MIIQTCRDCNKLVRFKPFVGTLHVCLSSCERAGFHQEEPETRRVGAPWRRRWKTHCPRCYAELDSRAGR